jgi:hypothetical protein
MACGRARKAKLAKLLARKPAGIVVNEHTKGAVVSRLRAGLRRHLVEAAERALSVEAVLQPPADGP